MQLHMRMLADPAIRRRIVGDTAMHRLMMEQVHAMPAEHREHMMSLMHPAPAPVKSRPTRAAATKAPTATKKARPAKTSAPPAKTKAPPPKTKAPQPKTKAADPHAGHRPPQ